MRNAQATIVIVLACSCAAGGSVQAAPALIAPATKAKTVRIANPAAVASAKPPRVTLSARFAPDRPGASTTVSYNLKISKPEPLRLMELRLPAGMGLARSSLGLQTCTPAILSSEGPEGCPSNSFVGHGAIEGKLLAEAAIEEHAGLTVVFGPSERERPTLLFFVEGIYPISEERILYGHLLPSAQPFGDVLSTEVPLIPSWPGGPDVGLTSLRSTIGPRGLHYYYSEHGKRIEFTPRGLDVPERCPAGGYPVQARVRWWGIAKSVNATTRVRCSKGTRRSGR